MPIDPKLRDQARKRDLARIHATANKLGMDRETYEAMLLQVTGQRSAADLPATARREVLKHLASLSGGYPGRPKNMAKLPGEIEKVEALLTDMGLSWAYANSIAQRMWRIPRMAWLQDADKVRGILAALHAEQDKRNTLRRIDQHLTQLSRDRTWIDAEYFQEQPPKGWTRHRKTLHAVEDWLAGQTDKPAHQETP